MAYLLVLFPIVIAVAAFATPSERLRPWWVVIGSLGHLALVWHAVFSPELVSALDGWLLLDDLGRVVLGFLSVLFTICALYAPGYLALRERRPNRVFCANLLIVLAMMTLVALSHHLGLMWVGMEATTLASAPLLYFNRNTRSLESTWKYLMVGSVGIALALLGSFFLAYSAVKVGHGSTLVFDELVRNASKLSRPWLHAGFVLLFIGYGTKMGLAPMHTWKPDAYGEAPGLVGTLLAGGVTSCAFLAVLRVFHICHAAADDGSERQIMVFFGLLSMAVSAVFMARQRDFKRMLAYSSVEHMGILVLGIGIGGHAVYGALLHLINNGLTKGVLFLSAGNLHRVFGSKVTDDVTGAMHRAPLSGWAFLIGFLAVTGSPPFGPFVSEFTIVTAAIGSGQLVTGGLFLALLGVVFIGMGSTVLAVVQGTPPPPRIHASFQDGFATGAPIVLALSLVLLLGLHVPAPLDERLRAAAAFLEVAR